MYLTVFSSIMITKYIFRIYNYDMIIRFISCVIFSNKTLFVLTHKMVSLRKKNTNMSAMLLKQQCVYNIKDRNLIRVLSIWLSYNISIISIPSYFDNASGLCFCSYASLTWWGTTVSTTMGKHFWPTKQSLSTLQRSTHVPTVSGGSVGQVPDLTVT